jgi:hypothetical protein
MCSITCREIPLSGVPIILLKKPGTLSEICTKNLGHFGKKRGGSFQNQIFHRRAATYTEANALSLLHKNLLKMCINYILVNTKWTQK